MNRLLTLLLIVYPLTIFGGDIIKTADPDSGLLSWQWSDDEVSITFNQLLPDQSRAYFQARGFDANVANRIALACVFQAIIRTQSNTRSTMHLNLADWRVSTNNAPPQALRLKSDWQAEWQDDNIPQAAHIAFRWSLFPSQQTFQPGDWSMGMVTLGLTPGERFDLTAHWLADNQPRSLQLSNMHCASDRHL